MVKHRTLGEFDVKMGWNPTLRHGFGLSKLEVDYSLQCVFHKIMHF